MSANVYVLNSGQANKLMKKMKNYTSSLLKVFSKNIFTS